MSMHKESMLFFGIKLPTAKSSTFLVPDLIIVRVECSKPYSASGTFRWDEIAESEPSFLCSRMQAIRAKKPSKFNKFQNVTPEHNDEEKGWKGSGKERVRHGKAKERAKEIGKGESKDE